MRRTLAVTGFAVGLFIAATAYSQIPEDSLTSWSWLGGTTQWTLRNDDAPDFTVDSTQMSLKEAYEICERHRGYDWSECDEITARWFDDKSKRDEADHALIRKWLGKP